MLPRQIQRRRARLRQDILRTAADVMLGLLGVVAVLLAFLVLWTVTP
jgi:hypothetical protein